MLDRRRRFENQPRIFLGRPQPRGRDAAGGGPRVRDDTIGRRKAEPAEDAAARERNTDQRVASRIGKAAAIAFRHLSPAGEPACASSERPVCAADANEITSERSHGGSNAATRSGHSIRHTVSARKYSATPAS